LDWSVGEIARNAKRTGRFRDRSFRIQWRVIPPLYYGVVVVVIDGDIDAVAGVAGGIRTVSIRYSVALAVLMPPQTTAASLTISASPEPVTSKVSPWTVVCSPTTFEGSAWPDTTETDAHTVAVDLTLMVNGAESRTVYLSGDDWRDLEQTTTADPLLQILAYARNGHTLEAALQQVRDFHSISQA